MALRLEIISRHRSSLGERGQKEFGQSGGTIGRSLESDWVLPDGQRFLSSRHASIDFRSGSYYIIDSSTNGVYINGSEKPVGRGKPQRLFTNDKIRIGEYEILVEIDDMDATKETMAETSHIDPVDLKQRVEAPDPTTYDLVDAYEITGVGIEMLLDEDESDTLTPGNVSLELAPDSGPKPAIQAKPAAAPPAKKAPPAAQTNKAPPAAQAKKPASPAKASAQQAAKPAAGKVPEASPAKAKTKPPPAGAADLSGALDLLLHGAGLAPKQLDQAAAKQSMLLLGQVLREIIVGLNENLYLRSAHKNLLKQPNTTIQPRGNNPLKFSASTEEAMENLLFRESEQYLKPVQAVRDAFDSMKWHQHALVKALEPAVLNYAARLDPERLEEKVSRGRTGAIMGAANKLKYWDLYKDLYVVVTQHPDGELPPQFVEELAEAYEHERARGRPTRTKPVDDTQGIEVKVG